MYNNKWIQQFCRMDASGHTQAVLKYQLAGESNTRRPLKRIVGCNTEEGTDHQDKVFKSTKIEIK